MLSPDLLTSRSWPGTQLHFPCNVVDARGHTDSHLGPVFQGNERPKGISCRCMRLPARLSGLIPRLVPTRTRSPSLPEREAGPCVSVGPLVSAQVPACTRSLLAAAAQTSHCNSLTMTADARLRSKASLTSQPLLAGQWQFSSSAVTTLRWRAYRSWTRSCSRPRQPSGASSLASIPLRC